MSDHIPYKKKLTKSETIVKWIGNIYFGESKYEDMLKAFINKECDWYLCGIDYQNGHVQYTHLEYEKRKEN